MVRLESKWYHKVYALCLTPYANREMHVHTKPSVRGPIHDRTGPEITPEITGKNTSSPAMIVYLPENLAGRNYWLTYLFGEKYLTLSTESYVKLSSDSILTSAWGRERHFDSTAGK